VNSVHLSGDSRYAVSGGADGTVRLLHARDGRELQKFTGHSGEVLRAAVSPDLRFVFSAGADGTVRLWDISSKDLELLSASEGGGENPEFPSE